jgi:hypothetical protein
MGVWMRYAFQAVATTLVLLPRHGTALLRGSMLLATSLFAFSSLRYLPVAEFTTCAGRVPCDRAVFTMRRLRIAPAETETDSLVIALPGQGPRYQIRTRATGSK